MQKIQFQRWTEQKATLQLQILYSGITLWSGFVHVTYNFKDSFEAFMAATETALCKNTVYVFNECRPCNQSQSTGTQAKPESLIWSSSPTSSVHAVHMRCEPDVRKYIYILWIFFKAVIRCSSFTSRHSAQSAVSLFMASLSKEQMKEHLKETCLLFARTKRKMFLWYLLRWWHIYSPQRFCHSSCERETDVVLLTDWHYFTIPHASWEGL